MLFSLPILAILFNRRAVLVGIMPELLAREATRDDLSSCIQYMYINLKVYMLVRYIAHNGFIYYIGW
eukprot:SAG31_NODE_4913_length_2871_cov_2.230159_5_plen_67_part_00